MQNHTQVSGFTLLELLVVVALLGLFSSVVFLAVGGARQEAYEAVAEANLNQARTLAGYYQSIHGDYYDESNPSESNPTNKNIFGPAGGVDIGVCNDPDIDRLFIEINNSGVASNVLCEVSSNFRNYHTYVMLNDDIPADFFCIDSTGFGGKVQYPTADPARDTDCRLNPY